MYHDAVGQFDRVASLMGLDKNVADRLRVPQRSTVVSFPFRHDTYNEVETIFGYRVQHLNTMGPTKGGIRFAPDVDLGEVTDLDSSLLALLLAWTREAKARGATLTFSRLPPDLGTLAQLYGVAELLPQDAAR